MTKGKLCNKIKAGKLTNEYLTKIKERRKRMSESEFMIFSMFCWFGLVALCAIFTFQQRKKTLLLRTFARMAKNQSPEKWTTTESTEGLPREYSTKIVGFSVVIDKYPSVPYYYRMFVSKENGVYAIFEGWRIAKTYKQVDQERRRTEKIIGK